MIKKLLVIEALNNVIYRADYEHNLNNFTTESTISFRFYEIFVIFFQRFFERLSH
jgi:hypothetical protein